MTCATPSLGERVLVARLRGGKERQRLDPLVANERLRKLGNALHHIDQVEHHPAFGAQHKIEISEPDVEIDEDHPLPALRERRTEGRGRCRLADAALAGSHDHYFRHFVTLQVCL